MKLVRTDLPGQPETPAHPGRVTDTARRTTLGGDAGVTLVEHALAALAGLRIDNCRIELDAAEPPGLDGSAAEDSAQHYALDHSARPGAAFRTVMSASHPSRMTTGHAPGRHGWTPTVDRAGTGTGAWRS